MKLFYINDCDYVAATSIEEVVAFWKEMGLESNVITEIPSTEWNDRFVILNENDEDGQPIRMPFSEYLEQFSDSDLPLIIASKP